LKLDLPDQRTQEYNNENLMDFCIGSVAFWAIGYFNVWNFNRLCHRNLSWFLIALLICTVCSFQTVAATAATIVSGAIAERTKFTTYLIFSLLMTLLIYPISGSWV
jgi:Amt family ammonium transporter